ncbi:MAG TPA: zinc ribbon domain-containing protein [Gemmatimonadales bacterium]|nr:zinc ribbon domain-containing protein [Gemmatimonadales bacterium]
MSIVIGLLVAVVAVLVVLEPILRPASAAPPEPGLFDEPEDDPKVQRKELALAALKEIEFDRATGKLSEGDYRAMLDRYTREAVEALRDAETPAAAGGNGHAPAGGAAAGSTDDAVERLIAETRAASRGRRFCSNCGASLEGSGRFCVECGAQA